MKLQIRKATLAILGLITSQAMVFGTLPAQAQTYSASVTKAQPSKTKQFFQKHEAVRKATIGAGVGTAAGAVTGLVSGKGLVRGAAIGAGTGATVGVINANKTMAKHPIMRDMATGTAAATGITMAATRGRGGAKTTLKGAAVGAALGLGVGLFRDKLK
ncbi:MAG: hypothetical protein WCT03_23885 [Candidatus Obscuribacterales bacterium]|jgi:hypothetical protein